MPPRLPLLRCTRLCPNVSLLSPTSLYTSETITSFLHHFTDELWRRALFRLFFSLSFLWQAYQNSMKQSFKLHWSHILDVLLSFSYKGKVFGFVPLDFLPLTCHFPKLTFFLRYISPTLFSSWLCFVCSTWLYNMQYCAYFCHNIWLSLPCF